MTSAGHQPKANLSPLLSPPFGKLLAISAFPEAPPNLADQTGRLDAFRGGRLLCPRIDDPALWHTLFLTGAWRDKTSKRPETAVDILYDRVLPFYEEQGIPVEAIFTDNGTEYKGRPMIHLFEIFLDFNDIEHRTTKVGNPRTNGFVERFNRTILDEFFRTAFREKFYELVDALQTDLDGWLHYYNHERPHRGYRNMGRRPIETMQMGKTIREELKKEPA